MLDCNIETGSSFLSSLSSVFFERKSFLNSWCVGKHAGSDLSKVAPETLLQSLSVMGNYLEILQEFQEFSIQETPLNNCFSSL